MSGNSWRKSLSFGLVISSLCRSSKVASNASNIVDLFASVNKLAFMYRLLFSAVWEVASGSGAVTVLKKKKHFNALQNWAIINKHPLFSLPFFAVATFDTGFASFRSCIMEKTASIVINVVPCFLEKKKI